jgi:DoxX-like protein
MNTALWIAQGVLAAAFAMSGTLKLAKPREQLKEQLGWVEDYSGSTVKLIGTAELLAALGLVLRCRK